MNTPSPQKMAATVPDETAVSDARQAARDAQSVDALRETLSSFEGCNLRFGARSTVFADGNPQSDIMFIGEAPGRDEDRQGLPFVGRAGQLLDKMLAAIDLDRTGCYITNMIPWRPPGNRSPTPLEIELCRPFIERHVELVEPKIVVFLGNVSTKALLGTTRGILSLRGTWSEYRPNNDTTLPALPTLHPAYLLRNPAQKKLSWQDFLSIRDRLDRISA
ncbi:uracil-DNA glycosylase [Hoeflea sp.]|uniref:uracil-DNA glycosylase n=1 Tax=Hoeflea sp. TaxID=1940281 RepID=UPI003B025864